MNKLTKGFSLATRFFGALLVLGIFQAASYAQELPSFTDGNAFVFDIDSVPGKAKDSVKTKNISTQESFTVTLYGYKDGGWETVGEGFLKATGDTDTLECKKKIKSYRYFAAATDSGKEFNCVISKNHNDLYIYFLDKTELSDAQINAAKAFDVQEVKGKFKDNVKMVGGPNLKGAAAFFVYGSNEKDGSYELLTCLALKGVRDTDTTDESYTGKKLTSYRYIKIVPSANKDFSFSLSKRNNDLIIQAD